MSLGNDLSKIRKERNLTLEDIYGICKIPIYTLQAIEDDSILTEPIDNAVYQRSFIRSYAKALKISDEHILAALEALDKGNYDETLYKLVQEELDADSAVSISDKNKTEELDGDSSKQKGNEPKEPESAEEIDDSEEITVNDIASEGNTKTAGQNIDMFAEDESSDKKSVAKKDGSAKKQGKDREEAAEKKPPVFVAPKRSRYTANTDNKPTVESVNWGEMSNSAFLKQNNTRIFIPIIIAVALIASIFIIYFNFDSIKGAFSSNEDNIDNTTGPEIVDPGQNQPPITSLSPDPGVADLDRPRMSVETSESVENEESIGDSGLQEQDNIGPNNATSDEVLEVAVYAAYNRLEPVRVNSDFNNKLNPYWMEQGEAGYVQFKDTLKVRGDYTRLLLLYNGNVIDAAYDNYYDEENDFIVITRSILESAAHQNDSNAVFPEGISAPGEYKYLFKFR